MRSTSQANLDNLLGLIHRWQKQPGNDGPDNDDLAAVSVSVWRMIATQHEFGARNFIKGNCASILTVRNSRRSLGWTSRSGSVELGEGLSLQIEMMGVIAPQRNAGARPELESPSNERLDGVLLRRRATRRRRGGGRVWGWANSTRWILAPKILWQKGPSFLYESDGAVAADTCDERWWCGRTELLHRLQCLDENVADFCAA